MKKNILITGGAGYIGSHTAKAFLDKGYDVTILDNLSTGFTEAVPQGADFVQGDVEDVEEVEEIEETDTNVIDLMPFLQKSLKAGSGKGTSKKATKKASKKTSSKATKKTAKKATKKVSKTKAHA